MQMANVSDKKSIQSVPPSYLPLNFIIIAILNSSDVFPISDNKLFFFLIKKKTNKGWIDERMKRRCWFRNEGMK